MKCNIFRLFNILIILAVNYSCSHTERLAPVSEFEQPPSKKVGFHIVTPGETLYSLAWRYNLDYRSLARVNGIGADFSIYPGQKLVLASVASKEPWRKPSARSVVKPSPSPVVASPVVATRSKKETSLPPKQTHRSVRISPKQWSWPAKGKIIEKFNSKSGLHKGIDLKGKLGEPVLAAADGTVVYSGAGLRGYGKLLIVKHSEKFLSAYAHNSELLVTEGVTVTSGQQIAKMGSSDTDSVKLHFEIRYDGKPVDPLKYLPNK